MYFALGADANTTRRLIILLLLILHPYFSAHAEDLSHRKSQPQKPLDPMNRPMDELGVTGKDDTLCSDRWHSCTTYDLQQFDQKYPGQPLKDLLRYGEPDWPDKPLDGRDWRDKRDWGDSLDHHDRLGKD